MAVQKQKRNFSYKGRSSEEPEKEAGSVPRSRVRKKTGLPGGNVPDKENAKQQETAGDRNVYDENDRSADQESVFKRTPENAAAEYVRYREEERDFSTRPASVEQYPGDNMDPGAEDSAGTAGSGRTFHKERNSFYRPENRTHEEDAPAGSRYTARHETRMFSENARRMDGESTGDTGRTSYQTGKTWRGDRGGGQTAREFMKEGQKSADEVRRTARETGETVKETAADTVDSITMFSELVTRPFETGKRTFSTGKETFSKEFGSIKEAASSAKDADEAIGSKAKEMLKAMAVRTFREAVMLPVKLTKAVIKIVELVLSTIATSGLNLLIMLLAVILAAAVLVGIILLTAILLIRYGGFWVTLTF